MTDADSGGFGYTVTVTGPDGQPAEVTIGEAEGAITYNEYWTGPSPWWKRAWRLLRQRIEGGVR